MNKFPLGGIAKSLLALFNEIEGRYEIDFFLFQKSGLFVPLIPSSIQVIESQLEEPFCNPHPKYLIHAFKKLSYKRFFLWCVFSVKSIWGRFRGGLHGQMNIVYPWIGTHTPSIKKHYDVAIAYEGGPSVYFLVSKIDADIKIGYVHSCYSDNETDNMLKPSDILYFPKLDYLVTISQTCLESLWKEFPDMKDRSLVIENICSRKMICKMADLGTSYDDMFEGYRLVSMGRIDMFIKGLDLVVEACKILKEKNVSFRWYWLGDGAQKGDLEKMVEENKITDVLKLLGAKTNPYPYIKDADIYVQPSRVEGKSVALDEVKALKKPIVVTNFSSVKDQFTDGVNALIAEINAEDIANKIIYLMNHSELQEHLTVNLSKEKVSNEEQALIFESLINK